VTRWLRLSWRLAAVLVLMSSIAGCSALPSDRQVKQFLGLERTFAHNDVPSPPSPDAYVLQLGMGQTRRIVVHQQPGRSQHEVTDPQAIASVLAVLRAGPQAIASPASPPLEDTLQLDFVAGPPERVVTAHYNPKTQTLQIYNIPTAAWPDHAVSTYTLPPAFGTALRDALEGQHVNSGPHRTAGR
jgi:hypothetical protein